MKKEIGRLLISDNKGKIRAHPYLGAAGMKGGLFDKLPSRELIRLPYGSRLFMLPQRRPVGYDPRSGKFTIIERGLAVSAFIAPGFTAAFSAAYKETGRPRILPLFSYAACAFYKGGIYAAALRVDRSHRHDPAFIDTAKALRNIPEILRHFPKNRLVRHLADCARVYGCPGAQNFFLGKYEGPLPVSPACNASCIGCISYQAKGPCRASQPRIKFAPSPEEVAEAALFHMNNVKKPVVSFGQGCEGEPLLKAEVIEKSIRLIRKAAHKGTININTNASRPEALDRLFDAGLDSVRISLNSVREKYYIRYYKPRGYAFKDVLRSVKISVRRGFVSINYLTLPGFTDSVDEYGALNDFLENNRINMIQWRNLNFDPLAYFRELGIGKESLRMLGIREIISGVKLRFPRLMTGYYNPWISF
ncbi:MAG: radical SAM protein [Candidatus Omnitrophica bacterium]|nr:radical SAM protein [Candidatus Omnitrophota bacterium]